MTYRQRTLCGCLAALLTAPLIAWSQATTEPPAAPATRPATRPAELTVTDIDGKARRPLATDGAKAAVVLFLSHDCPISNGFSPEINRICQAFGGEGKVRIHIVHPYGELSADQARRHATDYGYTVPVIIDTDRKVTRAAAAKVTPQAVVVDVDGRVLYSGRIDDTWADYGKRRTEPSVRDLRNALEAILAGKPVPQTTTEAIGCPIEE